MMELLIVSITEVLEKLTSADPNVDYHSRPELSSSEVAMYLRDPLEWWGNYKAEPRWKKEVSQAMEFGTAVHLCAERGGWDGLAMEIPVEVLNDDGHCKGKAWTAWKATNEALVYFKPGERNPLAEIWNNLQSNTFCRTSLDTARAEGGLEKVHTWDDEYLGPCRMKADCIAGPLLIDWKTTNKTDTRGFANDAAGMGYDVRLSLYRRGYRNLFGCDPEIHVVAIRSSGSYRVTPYRIPDTWLDDAEARLVMLVDEMNHFDLASFLDAKPVELPQPRFAKLDLEDFT